MDIKHIGNKVNQLVTDTGIMVGEKAKKSLVTTQNVGQRSAEIVKKGAIDISDKMKNVGYQNRLKKYNPLFPAVYHSEAFHIPNIIVIVDDAVRKNIDVCVGAIGWLGKVSDTEVLYLYDEAIEESGLMFIPMPQCDAIYYVDLFDRKRFVRSDAIFSNAHEGQVAELRHIAERLGAKSCSIEIREEVKKYSKMDIKVSAEEHRKGIADIEENAEQNYENHSHNLQSGKITSVFSGSDEPQIPELKWFKYNDSIKGLIEMRMSGNNVSKSETFQFTGMSTSALSQKAAYALDAAINGIGVKANSSISKKMDQESKKTIYFNIEF